MKTFYVATIALVAGAGQAWTALPSMAQAQTHLPFLHGSSAPGPVIVDQYYQELKSQQCSSTALSCFLNFSKVPPGQTLMVTYVTCAASIESPTANVLVFGLAPVASAPPSASFLTPQALGVSEGFKFFNSSNQVSQIIKPAQIPQIVVVFDTLANVTLDCEINGKLL